MQTLIKFLDKFYCAFRVYYVIRIRSTLPEIKMLTDVQTNTTYPLCTHFMYFVQEKTKTTWKQLGRENKADTISVKELIILQELHTQVLKGRHTHYYW